MPDIKEISPSLLKERHRLSTYQINSLLGRRVLEPSFEETYLSLNMVAEFLRVTVRLYELHIDFIPLKGPLLSFRLYDDANRRHYRDLDILLDPGSIGEAIVGLKSLGYKETQPEWPESNHLRKILLQHSYHIAIENYDTKFTIELHWRLLNAIDVSNDTLSKIIKSNLTTIRFADRKFTVLNNELELLYLVIHGGLHYWKRLKWLVDVNQYVKKNKIDIAKFNVLVDQVKARRMVELANRIHLEYFNVELLSCQVTRLPKKMVKYSLTRIKEEDDKIHNTLNGIIKAQNFALSCYPGLKYKFLVIRNYMFAEEYFGKNRIISIIPIFYFYSLCKLTVGRIRR